MKYLIFVVSVISVSFLGMYYDFHAQEFDFSKFDGTIGFLYFWDPISFLFVFIPTSIFFFVLSPVGLNIYRTGTNECHTLSKIKNHILNCQNCCTLMGWLGFMIGVVLMTADMRPETIGPNLSIAFLTVVYSVVLNIIFATLRSYVDNISEPLKSI